MSEGELSPATVLAKRAGLAWQFICDEGVIIDLDRQMLRGMNRSAWNIWSLLDGRRSLRDISTQVAGLFGQDPELVESDVLAFAHELSRRTLVQAVH